MTFDLDPANPRTDAERHDERVGLVAGWIWLLHERKYGDPWRASWQCAYTEDVFFEANGAVGELHNPGCTLRAPTRGGSSHMPLTLWTAWHASPGQPELPRALPC